MNGTASHTTLPVRFSGTPEGPTMRSAPLLGEHNTEILTGLGLSAADIEVLEQNKIIGTKLAF